MIRRAAVDFGSNTVGYLVAECSGAEEVSGTPVEHARESRYVRLSQGLAHSRRLHPEARERTLRWAEEIAERLRELQVRETRVVATEVLRRAEDADEFREELRRRSGLELEIIDGGQEAELAFSGVRYGWPTGSLAVLDIGGGSSELALGGPEDGRRPAWSVSLPVGAVNLGERAGEDREALAALVAEVWPDAVPAMPDGALVVMGGTARNLAAFDLERPDDDRLPVEAHRVSASRLRELGERCAALSPAQRVERYRIPAGRADVSMGGFAILEQVVERLRRPFVSATRLCLRHGILRAMSAAAGEST